MHVTATSELGILCLSDDHFALRRLVSHLLNIFMYAHELRSPTCYPWGEEIDRLPDVD